MCPPPFDSLPIIALELIQTAIHSAKQNRMATFLDSALTGTCANPLKNYPRIFTDGQFLVMPEQNWLYVDIFACSAAFISEPVVNLAESLYFVK